MSVICQFMSVWILCFYLRAHCVLQCVLRCPCHFSHLQENMYLFHFEIIDVHDTSTWIVQSRVFGPTSVSWIVLVLKKKLLPNYVLRVFNEMYSILTIEIAQAPPIPVRAFFLPCSSLFQFTRIFFISITAFAVISFEFFGPFVWYNDRVWRDPQLC